MFKRKLQAVFQRRMEGWKNSTAFELSWRGGHPDDEAWALKFKEQEGIGLPSKKKGGGDSGSGQHLGD